MTKKWFPLDDICRIGFALQALAIIIIGIYYTNGVELLPIFFILILQAVGMAFFWAICEYTLSNEIYKYESNKGMANFATFWSFGKAIGYGAGGFLKSALGTGTSLYIAIALNVIIIIIYPYRHVEWLRKIIEKEKQQLKEAKEIEM